MSTVLKEMKILKEVHGDLGIEIEVEGINLPIATKIWRNEEDGSLKGESREFVLKKPGSLEEVKAALDYLDKLYIEAGSTVYDDSIRTGVHVHVNCQKLTMTQLYNYMTVYLIMENLLVKWCGESRQGNLFCLRSTDAEYLLHEIIEAARDARKAYLRRFQTNNLRYASMNVKALGDYGSLEFRSMRGTRDLNLVYKWAETLLNLRTFAEEFANPQTVIERFSMDGPEKFMVDALGDNYDLFSCEEAVQLLWAGMRNAQDIAYCTDWQTFEPKTKSIGGLEFSAIIPDEEIIEPEEDV